jgi:tagatose 1,6-diphosphate aldolase
MDNEKDIQNEIAYYSTLPVIFNDFIDIPQLIDGEIELFCASKNLGNSDKKWVPVYFFDIRKKGVTIGHLDLRIGNNNLLYYGGHIGYFVDEPYRGNGYAATACRLLLPIMKGHGMTKILITNNPENTASRRVCEKLGAKLIRRVFLPEWSDMYQEGMREKNIFIWEIC